jgi:short-subunit dehydrogenase
MTMSDWHNRVILVTGASRGLGLCIATEFAGRGATVIMIARDQQNLQTAASQISCAPTSVTTFPVDVTDDEQVVRLLREVDARFGRLDVLVNAVGKSMRGRLESTTLGEQRELWELNYLASVRCTLAFLPHLRQSHGSVVFVGSLASKVAPAHLGAYPASKFPLAAFAQQLRIELDGKVHALLVCPGPIRRDDSGHRYVDGRPDVPQSALKPGGGARLRAIDPQWLSRKIVKCCETRKAELVVPGSARLLFALSQLSPRLADWLLKSRME